MEITVLKDAPDYVVCVKPHGVESEHQMPALLTEQIGGTPFLPVHRLDKETGGVMVYAKTPAAAAAFSRQIQKNQMEKTYLAVVKGCPEPAGGTYEDWLFRDRSKNKSYIVKRQRKGVKKASLSYDVICVGSFADESVSLVKIGLHTGRTHQIRVQFSGRNMPLIGDKKYGGKSAPALALWSATLSFLDYEGRKQIFEAMPPAEIPWVCFPTWLQREKRQINK